MTIKDVKRITLDGGEELYIDSEKYKDFRDKAVAEVKDSLRITIDFTPNFICVFCSHKVEPTGKTIAYSMIINRMDEPWFLDHTIEEMREAVRERLTIHYCLQSLKY